MKNIAIFGAGCFWGVELAFSNLDGVITTKVGYLGGELDNPSYQDVCSGTTGHAEVIQIEYDESVISYMDMLNVFWKIHDPTTLNSQGPDHGTQYRSAIFFTTDDQSVIAQNSLKEVDYSGVFHNPIVTEITKASKFYPAEDYHQKYLEKRGMAACGVK